jgi:hypothetical protein
MQSTVRQQRTRSDIGAEPSDASGSFWEDGNFRFLPRAFDVSDYARKFWEKRESPADNRERPLPDSNRGMADLQSTALPLG